MMSYIHAQVKRLMRAAVVAVVCGVMLFSAALPAYAIGSSKTRPSEGEAQLDSVQERAADVLKSEPRSMGDVKGTAEGGLNEVQGASDYNKMNRPENSQDAESVPEQIKRTFDALTDR